jgi:hypothetical protein
MNQTNTLKGMRQTAILFASMCCTAAALAIATPVLAEDAQSLRVAKTVETNNGLRPQA